MRERDYRPLVVLAINAAVTLGVLAAGAVLLLR